jgi:hypothetical protein
VSSERSHCLGIERRRSREEECEAIRRCLDDCPPGFVLAEGWPLLPAVESNEVDVPSTVLVLCLSE